MKVCCCATGTHLTGVGWGRQGEGIAVDVKGQCRHACNVVAVHHSLRDDKQSVIKVHLDMGRQTKSAIINVILWNMSVSVWKNPLGFEKDENANVDVFYHHVNGFTRPQHIWFIFIYTFSFVGIIVVKLSKNNGGPSLVPWMLKKLENGRK